jgi:hypothetical protein
MQKKLLAFFLLCAVAVILAWVAYGPKKDDAHLPEVTEASSSSFATFAELSKYFGDLAREKGAVYAYRVLRHATLPPQTDMHLLGHVIGDVLYRQKGKEGILDCTDEFRNACSHSIVTGLFADHGEAALGEIASVCQTAPGGSGAYTMCYHGLGHGVLAAVGYEMPEAVNLCDRTGTPKYNMRESAECVGGAVMEIISGGFHDPATWEKKHDEYLGGNDPFALCTASFMPQSARNLCLDYLTPHLVTFVGGDLGNPSREVIAKAMALCKTIPSSRQADKDACYRGFGKEFVAIVHARDTRDVSSYTDSELVALFEYCQLAPEESGIRACVAHATNSLYWGGENHWSTAVRFCSVISDTNIKSACMSNLIGEVGYYNTSSDYRRDFCRDIPQEFQDECGRMLGVSI